MIGLLGRCPKSFLAVYNRLDRVPDQSMSILM